MAKKKDHLYVPIALAKSVLLDVPARAACGFEKKFTREDLEITEYFGTCAHCMNRVAVSQPGEAISTIKKQGWTRLLERLVTEQLRPKWVMQTYTWTSSAKPTGTAGFPPAA